MSNCKICNYKVSKVFDEVILNKYKVEYLKCSHCGYLCTESPYWLNEAYSDAIAITDTGIFVRNDTFSKLTGLIILFLHKNKYSRYLDYAGGYGIFVRKMRDLGFDFYWHDKYCDNIFAKYFEGDFNHTYNAITSFEFIEHTVNPFEEIVNIFKYTDTWIFSTELMSEDIPNKNWWYYSFITGQHISFFSHDTFKYIANKLNIHYYNFGLINIMTKMPINKFKLILIRLLCFSRAKIFTQYFANKLVYVKKSLTIFDMNSMANKLK